ncbi:DUF488 domain-containing protein [Modestobacter excelsi]|uniref:DUF488 domain-containing protein n=1 Tax=Modestobacter excelsi TaxID=2213161 RepID=UPI00110CEF28|nr:DUF488 family protein [Modestobacter excelsi]
MSVITVTRVRDTAPDDGAARYLVDRLWPRGVRRDSLRLTAWLPDVAPSHELRRWSGHDRSRWAEFRRRCTAELDDRPATWRPLVEAVRAGDVTLLYAARDTEHDNAVALRDHLLAAVGNASTSDA